MMFKKQLNSAHRYILPYIMVFLTAAALGCIEDPWEPDEEVDTSGMEKCDSPETYRCNGGIVELCRMANGNLLWRAMEDCSNISGGVCEDPGDGSPPFCTGDYWASGYCPGDSKPASADCGAIMAVGCCNDQQQNLWCDDTGTLYCVPCWADSYNLEFCTWNADNGSYGCMYLENGTDDIAEDPSGTNPLLCGEAATDAGTDAGTD